MIFVVLFVWYYYYYFLIVKGEIRTAIGLARLLMNQKLKQFKGLIDDSEFNTGEREITCTDLEGFWDMVYYEVRYCLWFYP